MKKMSAIGGMALLLTACSGENSPMVQSMQKRDKELSCTEVLLEMNEAEFYKNKAEDNRGPKLKNVLMPLGYVSTYMNSGKAIEAADSRIGYLNKIYEIMGCEHEQQQYSNAAPRNTMAMVTPVPKPYVQQQVYAQSYPDGYVPIRQRFEARRAEEQSSGYAAMNPHTEERVQVGASLQ